MSKTAEVVLDTFNPATIGVDRALLFIGKRDSGKTFIMKAVCYALSRKIPEAVIFSTTEEGNGAWGKNFPPIYIHGSYNPEILQGIYDRQKKRRKQNTMTPILVILEDQSFDKSIFRCPVLANILMNGRHYDIMMMISTQYCRSVTTDLRSQFDFVFCCLEKIVANRKRLYEDYFGVFPTFESFNEVMMNCTANYGCLVMNNVTRSCAIQDSVFYFKAKDHGNYKFGSRAYWLFHYMHYKEEEDAEDAPPDPFDILRPKSRVKVSTRVRQRSTTSR